MRLLKGKIKISGMEIAMRKAVSWLVCFAVLFSQLPLIQVRAEATPFTDPATGINFSVDGNVYTVSEEQTVADGSKYVGIRYKLNGNTFTVISSYEDISGEKIILGSIDGKNVSVIDSNAFIECGNLTSVQIQDGVQDILGSAFYECDNLTSVQIPNSVQTIDGGVFQSCGNLTSIQIPSSMQDIGDGAFRYCRKLSSINFDGNGNSLEIRGRAFENSGITSISLPDRVTSVGANAFYNCTALTQVSWPSGATKILDDCFEGCTALTSFTIPEEVESVRNSAFNGCTALRTVTIPEGSRLSSIGAFAFSGCTSLTEVNRLPEGLTSLGYAAFEGCSSLSSIEIPNTVEPISSSVFKNCRSLTSISIPCTFDLTKFSSDNSRVVPDNGGQTYTVLGSDNGVVCRGIFKPIHNDFQWERGTDADGKATFNYTCSRCPGGSGRVEVEDIGSSERMMPGSSKLLKATKNPIWIDLTWSSSNPDVATVKPLLEGDTQAVLSAKSAGSATITVSTTDEPNGPQTSFDLTVKNEGKITNKDYPKHFVYTGSAIEDPANSHFEKESDADLDYEWYKGVSVDGESLGSTCPSAQGVYTLKVSLPETDTYTGAELVIVVDIVDVDVSGKMGTNGWYTGNVTVTAPQGYKIVRDGQEDVESLQLSSEGTTDLNYQLRYGDDFLTAQRTLRLNKDSMAPSIGITVGGTLFEGLCSAIRFERFFKNPKPVVITSEEGATIEYLLSDKVYEDVLPNLGWKSYEAFDLPVNSKNIVYARATDQAGNVGYASTDGFVIYGDAQAITTEFEYARGSKASKYVQVKTNGNTISKIMNGENLLTEGYGNDYIVSVDKVDTSKSIVTFTGDYLETLDEGEHTFTFSYNPQGEIYDDTKESNEAPSETSLTLKVNFVEPTKDSFIYSPPSNLYYDGTQKAVRIEPDFDGMGDVTVSYKNLDTGAVSTQAPKDAGHYQVYVTASRGEKFQATSGGGVTSDDWKFSIDLATPTADMFDCKLPEVRYYDGKQKKAIVTTGCDGIGDLTVSYKNLDTDEVSDQAPKGPGNYQVYVTTDEGDNYEATMGDGLTNDKWKFSIEHLATPRKTYEIEGFSYKNGTSYWFKDKDVAQIKPALDRYMISTKLDGEYFRTLTISKDSEVPEKIYLRKDENITEEIPLVETLNWDSDLPKVKISLDERNSWEDLLNRPSFGLFFKQAKSVSIAVENGDASGIKKVEYFVSDKDLTRSQRLKQDKIKVLEAQSWKKYKDPIALEKNGKYIVYARVEDNVGHVTYASSQGIVIYSDTQPLTAEFSYAKGSRASQHVRVRTNGNTINQIECNRRNFQEGYSRHYILSKDILDPNVSILTFMGSYLETLDKGEYVMTLFYNPQGEVYVEAAGNESPVTTQVKINV